MRKLNVYPAFVSALVLAAVCAVPLGAGGGVHAEEPRTALFLVDGSGSMWARFDTPTEKRAKIDVVRELLKPLISADKTSRIGLGSFGHRQRGDCSDVEIIAAPGADRDGVLGPLEKLNPKGKGPLAQGLRQSTAAIGASRPASIVVINDGTDNCRQDACAAAAEIAKTAPGIAIHVIAVGVDPGDHPHLQCITKATGGKFFDVRDPLGLAAAISEAGMLALGGVPAIAQTGPDGVAAPAAAVPPPLHAAALRATLALAPNGPPLARSARWRITKSGAGAPVKSLEAPGIAEDLDPGSYDVEAEIDGLKAKGQVTIDAGKPATLALALNGGHLIVRAKSAKDAAPGRAPIVTISEAAKGERAARTVMLGRLDSVDTLLPPAVYTVAIVDGQIRQERQVAIAEGAEAVAEFTLATGSLALSAVIQEGGAPLADVTFSVLEDDPDSPDGRREVLRSRAPEPQFTLPAGTYYVSARAGNAETRQRIALSAGDSIKKSLVILAAPLKVSAIVAGAAPPESAGLVYRIFNLEGDPREVARGTAPDFNGLLNAGRYRLSATLENHGASASQDVVLEAGKPLTSVLKIDAGEISFKAPAGAGLAAAGDSFWEIRDSGGRAIWHATVAEPKVLLSPGRYTVRMEARDRGSEAAFEVVSGERRHIELGPNPPGTP